MRLKKVTQTDPIERLAVSVKRSTAELLEAYRQHYKKEYGDEIEKSQLVEQILRDYISADRDFMRDQEVARGLLAAQPKKTRSEAV